MAVDLSYLLGDRDYYEPWDAGDPGPRYYADVPPPGWTKLDSGAWTHWAPPGVVLPEQGWKLHVSSSLANARSVLAVVAQVCADFGVPFKHLAGRRTFLLMHDKHAPRVQAGKFCALYPLTQDDALRLLQRLSAELAGISGPYVLTDRRFGDSECVSYRYGAFRDRWRVDAEGYQVPTMTGPDGVQVDDERVAEFRLPAGLTDPFRQPPVDGAPKPTGPVTLNGYALVAVLQHTNSGGAYRFRAPSGELVFVKEARAHNGYTMDGADAKARLTAEYLTLRAIHGRAPGLCPRPVKLFQHWEHSYLASELVPGDSLYRWMVTNNPALQAAPPAAALAEYHRRSLALLDQLESQLHRLHALGYLFLDLSPANVLVDEHDQLRLVDFEGVQPVDEVRQIMGTPGYQHPDPQAVIRDDPRGLDWYGLSALALLLLFPVHEAAEREPAILPHLRADLGELGAIEPRLWRLATRYREPPRDSRLPTPQAVRADTTGSLRWLAEQTANLLESMAQPGHPARVYPTTPLGYQTDTRALAAGTAGVLHALHRAGRHCDPAVVRRLRDEALASAPNSAPGLLFGSAGLACVLAELGELDAAASLLMTAAEHPLNQVSASLGGGAAGTALGLLVHHRRTGEQRWLDLADRLLAELADPDVLAGRLTDASQSGLVGGRTGVALALYQLHRCTGQPEPFERGLRLLQQELAYAEPLPVDGLGFKPTHADERVYPYLFAGSAGYAAVLSRYLADRPEVRFEGEVEPSDVLTGCLRACSTRFTAYPGLMPGLAGLAAVQAAVGRRLGRPDLVEAALTSARGLFRYAIPLADGLGWLGEPGLRLSADLWSGSAGILLALRQVIDPAAGSLFFLDEHDGKLRRVDGRRGTDTGERSDQHGRSPAPAG